MTFYPELIITCIQCDGKLLYFIHCIGDSKEMINQALMEVLLKIRDNPENPVLKIRPNFSYSASPKKAGSSPRRYKFVTNLIQYVILGVLL